MSQNDETTTTIAAILCAMGEHARPSCATRSAASSSSTNENSSSDRGFSPSLKNQDEATIPESDTSTTRDFSSLSSSSSDEEVSSTSSLGKRMSSKITTSCESKKRNLENDFISSILTISTLNTNGSSWLSNPESSVSSKRSKSGDKIKHRRGSKSKNSPPRTSYENRELRPAPYFYYIDRSCEPDDDPLTPLSPPLCVPNFVIKLHAILIRKDLEHIVSWMPHGRSWKIIDQDQFEKKVLPDYFKQSNISSFYRQANGWGFRRMLKGPDKGSFCSENFLRGVPHLCKKMRRIGGAKTIENANIKHEPNLWKISAINPLPVEIPCDDLNVIVLKTINESVKKDGPKAKMPFVHDIKKSASIAISSKLHSATTPGDARKGPSSEASMFIENGLYGGAGTDYACPPHAPRNTSHKFLSENMQLQNHSSDTALNSLQQIQHQNISNQAQAQPQTLNALQILALMKQWFLYHMLGLASRNEHCCYSNQGMSSGHICHQYTLENYSLNL
ncbi:hypothetical protein ACHAXS_001652 [Conticribra weissflogii]